jgi:hypothetical protein
MQAREGTERCLVRSQHYPEQATGIEIKHLQPLPPAMRVFDAGMGDATVLSQVMRHLYATGA